MSLEVREANIRMKKPNQQSKAWKTTEDPYHMIITKLLPWQHLTKSRKLSETQLYHCQSLQLRDDFMNGHGGFTRRCKLLITLKNKNTGMTHPSRDTCGINFKILHELLRVLLRFKDFQKTWPQLDLGLKFKVTEIRTCLRFVLPAPTVLNSNIASFSSCHIHKLTIIPLSVMMTIPLQP